MGNNGKLLLCSYAGNMAGHIENLCGKPAQNLKTICITTAANVYPVDKRDWLHREMQMFRDVGFELSEYDLTGKTKNDVATALSDADIIYMTGGNSYYLLEQMNKCDFKTVLLDRLNHGAFYIGSSAGCIVACPDIDYVRVMDDPEDANLTDYTGMNLIDFNILPHADNAQYTAEVQSIIDAHQNTKTSLIGLTDQQAILVTGSYIQLLP